MTTRQDPPHDEDCLCREAERTARGLDGLEAMLGDDEQDRDQRVEANYQESARWLAERVVDLEDEAARRALDRVRHLHTRETDECWDRCGYCDTDWPCPTAQAIDRSTDE